MKRIIFLSLILFSSSYADYRFVIYTDQEPPVRAQEVREYFQNTPPFSDFEFEMEIRSMATQQLGCEPTEGIPRLIVCDTASIIQEAYRDNFDQAFVVSDSDAFGASGGAIPVITSSSTISVSTIIHEYMHVLGFCDEYIYSAEDLQAYDYCAPDFLSRWINAVEITPLEEGYSSDQQARSAHSRNIPWYRHIQEATPISTQTLGTPSVHSNDIGLFPSSTCQNSTRTIHLWKPGQMNTIMSNVLEPIGALEPLLREALSSIGLQPRSEAPTVDLKSSHLQTSNCQNRPSQRVLSHQNEQHVNKIYNFLSEELKKD